MTRKELEVVLSVLDRIDGKDAKVDEAIAYLERDIARRIQQSKAWKDNNSDESRYLLYGR